MQRIPFKGEWGSVYGNLSLAIREADKEPSAARPIPRGGQQRTKS